MTDPDGSTTRLMLAAGFGNPCQLFIGGLSHATTMTEAALQERVSPSGELSQLTAGVQVCAGTGMHWHWQPRPQHTFFLNNSCL